MKIERISLGLKKVVHYTAGGILEKKFESKDTNVHIVETISYVEKYCTDNGFTVFAIDNGNYYLRKE